MKPTLSLLVSGIRNTNWVNLYDQMAESCNRHSFEIVFVSPYDLPIRLLPHTNVKYVQDFGSPSRCLQLASTMAEGQFIAIASDDVRIHENAFSDCIDQLLASDQPEKDIIALRYTEGPNFAANPNDFLPIYWHAKYHGGLRLAGIDDDWKICLMFLMRTDLFRYYGGIDCDFEHFNCNLHDLAFRAQRNGSRVLVSKDFVTAHDWDPHANEHNSPILAAYYQNDKDLFESMYSDPEISLKKPIQIDYDNWKRQPERWPRRFG